MAAHTATTDVLVVGAGPVGLALANVLGQAGTEVIVVEADEGLAVEPRAVSIDDEAMRLVQSLDLLDTARGVVMPGTGTHFFGADGRLLGRAVGPARPVIGHPIKNPIDHPEFQAVLLEGIRRFPEVAVRFSARFEDLAPHADGVEAWIATASGTETVAARYLVGADGGRSAVRQRLGIEMDGGSSGERWLVVDTVEDPHTQRFAMHFGDPRRPYVIVPGLYGRCRYEFMLFDGELEDGSSPDELARRLVAPLRPRLDAAHVRRCTVYTFHSLVARSWREGRVLLAGDAAHMMPPFAGQGLNTGLRDAFNLGWKLNAAVAGTADESVLDSYEVERRPHAVAMVQLSRRMGKVMMTRSRARAWMRDRLLRGAGRLPIVRRSLAEMRFKPPRRYENGLFAADPEWRHPLNGEMLPQPRVMRADGSIVWLDDVIGPGWALLAVDCEGGFPDLADPLWERLAPRSIALALGERQPPASEPPVISVSEADQPFEQLEAASGQLVLLRPDRFVFGVFEASRETGFATLLRDRIGRVEIERT